jgi:PAS domain S-box-containing protein
MAPPMSMTTPTTEADLAAPVPAGIADGNRLALLARAVRGILYLLNFEADQIHVMGHEFNSGPASPQAVGVERWLARVLDEDRESVHASLRASRHGRDHELEYRIRLFGGRVVHVVDRGVVEQDASGRPIRLLGCIQDVTARVEAERTLRSNEARFRALIARSSDMVAVIDQAGCFRFISPSAEEQLGWPAAEVVARSASLLIHPEDLAATRALLRDLLARPGSSARLGLRLRRRDGTAMPVEVVARNLVDDPDVAGLVINARDVTEQRRLEAQFRQAQKLESLGRLAGGVAHDFNNLLTVILSCGEILLEDSQEGRAVRLEDIEAIRSAGERARDLTKQLLAFARKQVITPAHLDLNTVVVASERLLRRVLGEDVRLLVEAATAPLPVLADPGQLEQVLLNLAVNARDAMPRGGTLTISTAEVDLQAAPVRSGPPGGAGAWVELVVRATGEGLTQEVQSHLFEPFFTTKEQGKGTGLGLATVHGIVAQAGGHLHVESEVGRGSAFHVWLPRTEAPPQSPEASGHRAPARGTETVLVVEDDAQVRAVTVRALRGAGYQVLTAGRGDEALELMRRHQGQVDLVVSDVVMPGLSGREVADALRHLRPGLPVLFVSGYTQDAIVDHGVLASGFELLEKPFTPASLVARVRALLDRG